MSVLLAILIIGILVGAYWLGWNDRELKAQADDSFRRLDAYIASLADAEQKGTE